MTTDERKTQTITDDETGTMLAQSIDAEPEHVMLVMEKPANVENARSDWKWVRMANGDLMLAVFPWGDTYDEVTNTINF